MSRTEKAAFSEKIHFSRINHWRMFRSPIADTASSCGGSMKQKKHNDYVGLMFEPYNGMSLRSVVECRGGHPPRINSPGGEGQPGCTPVKITFSSGGTRCAGNNVTTVNRMREPREEATTRSSWSSGVVLPGVDARYNLRRLLAGRWRASPSRRGLRDDKSCRRRSRTLSAYGADDNHWRANTHETARR